MQMNVLEAKTSFSRLLRLLESGKESSITIARNGQPIAVIIPYQQPSVSKRIGIAKGKFKAPEDFDLNNEESAAMLMEGSL